MILYQNYVSTCTKMVLSDSKPLWVAYKTMTFDLTFDLEIEIEDKMSYHRLCLRNLPGKLAVACDLLGTFADVISRLYPAPRPLTLNLTLQAKCQFKSHGYVGKLHNEANYHL